MSPRDDIPGHAEFHGTGVTAHHDARFHSGGGGVRGTGIAVALGLKVARDIMVQQGRHQGNDQVEPEDRQASVGSISSRKSGHRGQYSHETAFRA